MTLHVSEDWSHVAASFEQDGLSALGGWLPNYVQSVAGDAKRTASFRVADHISALAGLKAENVAGVAARPYDCVIPFMDMQRP